MYYKNFSKKKIKINKNKNKNKRTKSRKRRTRTRTRRMTGGESFKSIPEVMKVRIKLIREYRMSGTTINLFDKEIEKATLREELAGPERNAIALGRKIAQLEKDYNNNRVDVASPRYATMDHNRIAEITANLLAAQDALDDLMIAAAIAAIAAKDTEI